MIFAFLAIYLLHNMKRPTSITPKILKNLFLVIFTFIVILTIFSSLYSTQESPKQVTLNDLANNINNRQVKDITVSGNTVDATLKNDTRVETQKETESSLSETLKNYGVDPKSLSQIPLNITNESGWKYWMGILIPTLIPVIIIALFFWWTFRQAKAGANQAFSFGKSNIKLFTSFKDRATFADVAGLKEAKQELMEVVDFLKNPKKYLDLGAQIPRGSCFWDSREQGKHCLPEPLPERRVFRSSISVLRNLLKCLSESEHRVQEMLLPRQKEPPLLYCL